MAIVKHLWIVLFLGLGIAADLRAQTWVGSDCVFRWNAPTTGGPVQGYKLYLEQKNPVSLVTLNVGNVLEYQCTDAGLADGDWEAWVTAYNPAGESDPSNTVPFVYYDFILYAPGSPTGVSVSAPTNP